jgi:iron-regulated transporter 1
VAAAAPHSADAPADAGLRAPLPACHALPPAALRTHAAGAAAWAVYARQPVFPAAVALALLYFTVLSLGFLMTAYLHWRGVSDVTLSLFRGAGAAAGLAAAALFPRAARAVPLPALAATAAAFQLAWLIIGVLPNVASPASAPLLRLLMASIALSRAGLWMTDLAVSQARVGSRATSLCYRFTPLSVSPRPQLLQDGVAAAELGTVNGVQGSLCAAFEMASFAGGLLLHRYDQFRFLMLASCAAVAAAALTLARHAVAASASAQQAGDAELTQLLSSGDNDANTDGTRD